MRTSRMIKLVSLLLKNNQQTAEELADYFKVSTKTIYRDIDDLARAGIPIFKQQGVNGGIVLSKDYAINRSKLTTSEEAALLVALENIKKLPNAQLDYALKLMKQYFNEAGTLWVNTDDVSLDIQDKFHRVKRAVIEKNVIDFNYYTGSDYIKYKSEPYELRISGDVWKLLIRNLKVNSFEEIYLSRMTDIQIKSKQFRRREVPDEFGKRYGGEIKQLRFEVLELTEALLNRYPVECFELSDSSVYLNLQVKSEQDGMKIQERVEGLKLITTK